MQYSILIELPGLPKPINAIGRKHWAVKTKEANYWKQCVALSVIGKKPPAPLLKAHIIYTRFSSVAPDCDGLTSSLKHVQDGLIEAGIIKNDRWENIGMPDYLWSYAPKKQGRITIEVIALPVSTVHKYTSHLGESYTCHKCGHRNFCIELP